MQNRWRQRIWFAACGVVLLTSTSFAQTASGPAVWSGLFGSRDLQVETPNNPGNDYTMIHHVNEPDYYLDEMAYDSDRGYGFEVLFEDAFDAPWGERNGGGVFGPFDDSPNGRNNFGDELYNSFIGFKSFTETCDSSLFEDDDRNGVCADEIEPEGGIFRIDVPNGTYGFVGVFGDSQHNHAHRVVVEDGGDGLPGEFGENHVVLINNHNTPDYVQYVLSEDFPGSELSVGRDMDEGGNLAVVGFGDSLPPAPTASAEESPLFVYYGEDGNALVNEAGEPLNLDNGGAPSSPTIEVTQGFIRVHLLQANANDTIAFNPILDEEEYLYPRDANGTDVILFEVVPVGPSDPLAPLDDGTLTTPEERADYVHNVLGTWIGDSNLDGEFNSGDLVDTFTKGEYEDDIEDNSTWTSGDWDGDKDFTSSDFVAAFTDGGYEQGPRPGVAAVPEPSAISLLLIGMLAFVRRR